MADASHAGSAIDQRQGRTRCRVEQGHTLRVQQRILASHLIVAEPYPRAKARDDLIPAHRGALGAIRVKSLE